MSSEELTQAQAREYDYILTLLMQAGLELNALQDIMNHIDELVALTEEVSNG